MDDMAGEPSAAEGLPEDWDGHEKRQYPFFVTSVYDITPEGWRYIYSSTNTHWVIIPERTEHADYNHRLDAINQVTRKDARVRR